MGAAAGLTMSVDSLLKDKKIGEALNKSLENCPPPSDDGALGAEAESVLKVLSKAKDADMQPALSGLSDDEDDLLMRLLYAFLAKNQSSSSVLRWHQALTGKAGVGCIMRAIS